MADNLIIVESPAKVKTIKKFLGSNYDVEASGGHVRDLPKSNMGIDIENGFEPKYITIRGKGDLVSTLRKKAKKAKTVYLATDPDREGEAIAWHLKEALALEDAGTKRITFNEITKTAVKDSLKKPRSLDEDLIDAQQSRRILDRLVGYSISPLLWRKVKRGLSAGRVQSATLCMIAKRDAEIAAFVPEEYWTVDAEVYADGKKKKITLHLIEKERIPDKETADRILAELEHAEFTVQDIKAVQKVKKAPLPYTTSTLQQDASRLLNLSPQKTMRIAQQLYEGVSLKGSGTVGVITYLRTDSVRVADEADAAVRGYVKDRFGDSYEAKRNGAANKGRAQDAHEAIRPTDVSRTPDSIKDSLDRDQLRLYKLIWNRFVASRMADSVSETLTARAAAAGHVFTASATRTVFDGFRAIYDYEEKEKKDGPVETLTADSRLETVQEALRVDAEKIRSKGISSVRSRVTNIRPYLPEGTSLEDFKRALLEEIAQGGKTEFLSFTAQQEEAILRLKKERYDTRAWNYASSPSCTLLKQKRIEGCGKLELYVTVEKDRITELEIRGDFFAAEDPSVLARCLLGCRPEKEDCEKALSKAGVRPEEIIVGLSQKDFLDLLC